MGQDILHGSMLAHEMRFKRHPQQWRVEILTMIPIEIIAHARSFVFMRALIN